MYIYNYVYIIIYIDTHILSLVQQWDEIPPTSTNLLAGCNWSPERPALRPWIADPKKKRWIPKMLGGDGQPLFGQNPTFSTYGSWHVMTCHDPKITNSDCKSENQSNTGFTQRDVWRHLHCLGHGAMGHKVEEMQMWELDSAEEALYLPWFLLNYLFCWAYWAHFESKIKSTALHNTGKGAHFWSPKEHVAKKMQSQKKTRRPIPTPGIIVYSIDDKSSLMTDIYIYVYILTLIDWKLPSVPRFILNMHSDIFTCCTGVNCGVSIDKCAHILTDMHADKKHIQTE